MVARILFSHQSLPLKSQSSTFFFLAHDAAADGAEGAFTYLLSGITQARGYVGMATADPLNRRAMYPCLRRLAIPFRASALFQLSSSPRGPRALECPANCQRTGWKRKAATPRRCVQLSISLSWLLTQKNKRSAYAMLTRVHSAGGYRDVFTRQ